MRASQCPSLPGASWTWESILLISGVTKTVAIEVDSLAFIINHVFLPPKLPQRSEIDAGEHLHNSTLLRLCVRAAEGYQQLAPWEVQEAWEHAVKMLMNFSLLDNSNALDAGAFKKVVLDMKLGGWFCPRGLNCCYSLIKRYRCSGFAHWCPKRRAHTSANNQFDDIPVLWSVTIDFRNIETNRESLLLLSWPRYFCGSQKAQAQTL